MSLLAFDHVQLAMPKGEERRAREFYSGVLGMSEEPKPGELAARGGVWFRSGPVRLHLGVEADFRPALKTHPALLVDDLDALVRRCADAGHPPRFDAGATDGSRACYIDDPFGNRLEFVERHRLSPGA